MLFIVAVAQGGSQAEKKPWEDHESLRRKGKK